MYVAQHTSECKVAITVQVLKLYIIDVDKI